MPLNLYVPYANEAEISLGLRVAYSVFGEHGRKPGYCSIQADAIANGEDYDAPALQTWHEAEARAIETACHGWVKIPESAYLEWVE